VSHGGEIQRERECVSDVNERRRVFYYGRNPKGEILFYNKVSV
jgi:hypothetical protein